MKVKTFLKDINSELRKVKWINKKEVLKGMLAVILSSSFIATLFYIFDIAYMYINKIFN